MYNEKEIEKLMKTAQLMGLKDVELGYGKCLKDGKVEDTKLQSEETYSCGCTKKK